MRSATLFFTIGLTLLGAGASSLSTVAPAQAASQVQVVPMLLLRAHARKRERFIANAMRRFRKFAGRDRVLTQADVELHAQIGAARLRAMHLQRYLRFDLDGDLIISREELDTHLNAAATRHEERRVFQIAQMDRDADGQITMREILAAQLPRARKRTDRQTLRLRELLAVDPNDDGQLTVQEFASVVETVFDSWDTNGDWELDPSEQQTVQAMRLQARARERLRSRRR